MTAAPLAGAAGFAGVWHSAAVDRHRLPATQAAVVQSPVFITSSNLFVGDPPPIEGLSSHDGPAGGPAWRVRQRGHPA